MIEKTLVVLKPDCVQRGFSGEIITRFERVGYKIVGMKMIWPEGDFFKKHYYDVEERHGTEILMGNVKAMTSGPVIAFVLEGVNVIENIRKMVGPTEPKQAQPGTIRGDYAHYTYALADKNKIAVRNIIHASANTKDAEYEISLWFSQQELFNYQTVHEKYTL
ncbi:nucleoside-diphosphate kinase [Candidatus Woesearchaeota archaeon]|nr:nucleoside-diphosphate kinase [Candidatus Woesearchaeota archaeon]